MITLTETQIEEALPRIDKGLRSYCWLQNNFINCNVSIDREFQSRYNAFYRVRRNAQWRKKYFSLMESTKTTHGVNFEYALHWLFKSTGNFEASFASKLVATLNPDVPVIDRFVLANMDLRLPYPHEDNRERKIIAVYNELVTRFSELMNTPSIKVLYSRFDQYYPHNINISNLKKVDLVLWQLR